jgi:uncharacterized glyoxalase superfamily protein PhnB
MRAMAATIDLRTAIRARSVGGDQVFECIDPFGYLWEISEPTSDLPTDDALASTRDSWYGR